MAREETFMWEIHKDLSANIAVRGATGPYQAFHGPKSLQKAVMKCSWLAVLPAGSPSPGLSRFNLKVKLLLRLLP